MKWERIYRRSYDVCITNASKVRKRIIRIRPYKATDASTILSWCQDERVFYQWVAGVMDVLKGEKVDGVWKFTEEDLAEFFQNPYVKPSLQAKNKAIVFDFLAQNEKRTNEICTIIDVCVETHKAEEISYFFCEEINKRNEGNINFSFEKNGAYARVSKF